MSKFIKNLLMIIFLVTGFFVFSGTSSAEACEVTSAGFRPSGIINNYNDQAPPIVYFDMQTSNCNTASPSNMLRVVFYSIDWQLATLDEIEISSNTMVYMAPSSTSNNPFPQSTLSSQSEFSIPILLGEDGNENDCEWNFNATLWGEGGALIGPNAPSLFLSSQINNLLNGGDIPDCMLFAKIYKSTSTNSSTPQELIFSYGAINDPKLLYECSGECNLNWNILGSFCFGPNNPQNTNNGLLPYSGTCPLQNSTISITTLGGNTINPNVGENNYSTEPLAPLPGFTGNPNLGQWLESLFTILIVIAGILALIMIIVGGITYITSESFGGKGQGKAYIINAIIGLVLALGAWVILNTINPNLAEDLNIIIPSVTLDGPTKEWNNGNASAGTNIAPSAALNGQPIVQGMPWPSDSAQRQQLAAQGITVNTSNDCSPTAGGSGCTSVYFDSSVPGIIDQIISFKNTCNCEIVITGGSEAWLHRTHGPNKKVIDMRATESLNIYLNGLPGGPSPSNTFPTGQTIVIAGVGRFYAEPSGSTSNTTAKHWHITLN